MANTCAPVEFASPTALLAWSSCPCVRTMASSFSIFFSSLGNVGFPSSQGSMIIFLPVQLVIRMVECEKYCRLASTVLLFCFSLLGFLCALDRSTSSPMFPLG